MATTFGMFPFLLKLYADGGYQGPLFRAALKKIMAQVNVAIVKRSDPAKAFSDGGIEHEWHQYLRPSCLAETSWSTAIFPVRCRNALMLAIALSTSA